MIQSGKQGNQGGKWQLTRVTTVRLACTVQDLEGLQTRNTANSSRRCFAVHWPISFLFASFEALSDIVRPWQSLSILPQTPHAAWLPSAPRPKWWLPRVKLANSSKYQNIPLALNRPGHIFCWRKRSRIPFPVYAYSICLYNMFIFSISRQITCLTAVFKGSHGSTILCLLLPEEFALSGFGFFLEVWSNAFFKCVSACGSGLACAHICLYKCNLFERMHCVLRSVQPTGYRTTWFAWAEQSAPLAGPSQTAS